MKPDGRPTAIQLYAQDEWVPLEGTRWWVKVGGQSHRLDSYGFETNYGPLYQSPDGTQVVTFRTFRNTIDGGLCFDLVTGQVTEAMGRPTALEAVGWKKLDWEPVGDER